jgi:hypothetical protein
MKKYCTCGAVNEYGFDEPKYCNQCGKPFAGALPIAPPARPTPRIASPSVAVETEDDGLVIPDIDKLDVEIEGSVAEAPLINRVRVADVIGNNNGICARGRPEKVSKKKFLAQFKEEAGSVRGQPKSRTVKG